MPAHPPTFPRLLTSWLVLAALAVALTACAGTRQAYQSAETLDETAKVVVRHYTATTNEATRLIESGNVSDATAERIRELDRDVYPLIQQVEQLAAAHAELGTAETEAELAEAIDTAVVALSDLIDAVEG